jgi:hypothetical protein
LFITQALRNKENIVETEIIAVFDVEALIGTQEKIRARCDSSRETERENSDRSTQVQSNLLRPKPFQMSALQ